MTTFIEGPRTAEYLRSEANDHRSRDVITLAAGVVGTLEAGTVLGRITATDTYTTYNPANADGSQNVAAILFEAGKAGQKRTATTRDAEVKTAKLVWFSGANATQITAGITGLKALGIIARS
ncbi:head decoration protein [Agrobacterium sp. Ap1]|uniref:head decoration protein n=1 Tax=Agrobacterium sp. Ap1 TaxID=2815337 RepID=UPI001A8F2261|nr:head decoration protein [Agrobacterium sp. Ap1]MBO0142268.1 head decoration protein [Agrobacterium sp. Ap1]